MKLIAPRLEADPGFREDQELWKAQARFRAACRTGGNRMTDESHEQTQTLVELFARYEATEHGKRSQLHAEICREIFRSPTIIASALKAAQSSSATMRAALVEARPIINQLAATAEAYAESDAVRDRHHRDERGHGTPPSSGITPVTITLGLCRRAFASLSHIDAALNAGGEGDGAV